MGIRNRIQVVTLVLTVWLLLPVPGKAADTLIDYLLGHKAGCPPSSYSPCHYWTPSFYRLFYATHDLSPSLDQFPPGPSPEMTPRYKIYYYKCPAVPPPEFPYGQGSRDASDMKQP
jgi:hypothetical protein